MNLLQNYSCCGKINKSNFGYKLFVKTYGSSNYNHTEFYFVALEKKIENNVEIVQINIIKYNVCF